MFAPNPHRPLGQTLLLGTVVIGTAELGAVVLWAAHRLVVAGRASRVALTIRAASRRSGLLPELTNRLRDSPHALTRPP